LDTIADPMAARRQTSTPKQQPPADLEVDVRHAVRDKPGLTAPGLKKHLPVSHQRFVTPAWLKSLAARGDVFLFMKGKTALLFPSEPLAEIDRSLPSGFADPPMEADALKATIAEVAPGHEVVFDLWVKLALSRRALFAHAPAQPKAKKRYGSKPDLSAGLKSVLKALKAALAKFDAQGVSRDQIAAALLDELGVQAATARVATEEVARAVPLANAEKTPDDRSAFVSALKTLSDERPREALLSVRELRPRTTLGKEQFDRIALELAREGFISLHHHDHAAALPESERVQLVEDARGTYFNGIAPRWGHV
jgi:hypothetical protein